MAEPSGIEFSAMGGLRPWQKQGRRLAAFVLCGALAASNLTAEPFVADSLILIDVGVYCPDQIRSVSVEAPETVLGYIHHSSDTVPVSFATTLVPAQLGFGFGMRMQAQPGLPDTSAEVVLTHPSGPTGEIVIERWNTSFSADRLTGSRFMFEFDFELALGEWVFEVHKDDALMFREVFDVVPAQLLPQIVKGCSKDIPIS